jgi:membrane protein DedA with SNARE-associated domain
LRITAAVIIGISRIPLIIFLVVEAISVVVWAAVISAAGYFFGRAVEEVLGRAAHIEKYGLAILIALGVAVWLYHRWKERRSQA